jgi:hypothetical protein
MRKRGRSLKKNRNKKNNTLKIKMAGGGSAALSDSKIPTILFSRRSNRPRSTSGDKQKALSWSHTAPTSTSRTPTSPPIQIKRLNRRIRQSTVRPFVETIRPGEQQNWYQPTFDIINTGKQIPSVELPNEPVNEYTMSPFQGTYDNMTMVVPFDKTIAMSSITPEEYAAVKSIQTNPATYSYLAPIIYEVLTKIGKVNVFGLALVYGRIRDEIIPIIIKTPANVLKPRLFFNTESEVKTFVTHLKELYTIGPTPKDPRQLEMSDIRTLTPLSRAPSANSLQVVGYNTHPMFRPNPLSRNEEMQLVKASAENPKLQGDEFITVIAHGAIGNELSPEMKILASKYLRIIEVGRAGQLTGTLYKSFAVELNKILRNPDYFAMFDNTFEGGSVRRGAFQVLCPYFSTDNVPLCETSETFNLIEITHERLFSGHHPDNMIPQGKKITYKSILNFITLGIFLPVEYENDMSTRYVSKKELFRLYPGTTFLSLSTSMRLIETLLPIAIKNNKRLNCFIMSCSVSYTQGDDIPQSNILSKIRIKRELEPRNVNIGLHHLMRGKKFIFKLNNLLDRYIATVKQTSFMHVVQNKRQYINGYRNYIEDKKYDELFEIAENIIKYHSTHFDPFIQFFSSISFIPDETFSFALLGESQMSNKLIEHKTVFDGLWYRQYIMEIIKVKIFLMDDFIDICYTRLLMVVESLSIFIECFNKLRTMYPPLPTTPDVQSACNLLERGIYYARALLEYFTRLNTISSYINDGMEENQPDSFSGYARYLVALKQYNEGNSRSLYEEITDDRDYDRYEHNAAERLTLLNPLLNGTFRRTNKHLYKYKAIQNYDDAVLRRRSLKKKIYDKYGVGKLARKANRSKDISV